jgi:hypothetical protein
MTSPMFLSGVSTKSVRLVAREAGIGLLVQPGTRQLVAHRADYAAWAIDNGCFKAATYIGDDAYIAWLASLPTGALFATAPDVVGDADATLLRSRPMLARIRELGLRAAFVAQDGSEVAGLIPWGELDVLFVGGSTEWKLGAGAAIVIAEARLRGVPVHVGRVNSGRRFRHFAGLGVETMDGTFLAFGPEVNLPRLLSWAVQSGTSGGPAAGIRTGRPASSSAPPSTTWRRSASSPRRHSSSRTTTRAATLRRASASACIAAVSSSASPCSLTR